MKAYTDIEQSKKLAEILPLKSADMSWASTGLGKPFARTIPSKGYPEEICPCWSLAALLDAMPKCIDMYDLAIILSSPIEWGCVYQDINGNTKYECYMDNQVDACVEMILKLKEKDLI